MEKIIYKCLSCNQDLIGQQRKYCSSKCCESYRRNNNSYRIEYMNKYRKDNYRDNREEELQRCKKYYKENKDKKKAYDVKYYADNYDKKKAYEKKYRKENKEKIKKYNRNRIKGPFFRINSSMSKGIGRSIKSNGFSKNRRHWEDLVGYTKEDLKKHLEKQFKDGMSWDNYGSWHLDHIIPKAFFKYSTTDDVEFKYCWSLYNLQPLWRKDNWSKQGKVSLDGKQVNIRRQSEQRN